MPCSIKGCVAQGFVGASLFCCTESMYVCRFFFLYKKGERMVLQTSVHCDIGGVAGFHPSGCTGSAALSDIQIEKTR